MLALIHVSGAFREYFAFISQGFTFTLGSNTSVCTEKSISFMCGHAACVVGRHDRGSTALSTIFHAPLSLSTQPTTPLLTSPSTPTMDRERTPSRIPLPPTTTTAIPTPSNARSNARSTIPTVKHPTSYPQVPVSAVPSRRLSRLPSAIQPPKPPTTAPAASKRNISSHSVDTPIPRARIAVPAKRRVTSSPLVRKPSVKTAGSKAENVKLSLASRPLTPFGRDAKPPSPTLQQLRKLSGGFVSKLQKGVGKASPKALAKSSMNPVEKPPKIPTKSPATALQISLEKPLEKPETPRKLPAISFQNPLEMTPEKPQTPRRSVKGRPPTPFQAREKESKSPPIPTRTDLSVIIPLSGTENTAPSRVENQPPSTPKNQRFPSGPTVAEFSSPASIETVWTPMSNKMQYSIRKDLPPLVRGSPSPYDETGPVNLQETPPRLKTFTPIAVRYSRKPSFPWSSPLASPTTALQEEGAAPQAKPAGPQMRDAASQTDDLRPQDASSQGHKEAAAEAADPVIKATLSHSHSPPYDEAADALAFASEERALSATLLITKLNISFDRMRMDNALRTAEVKLLKAHSGKALDVAVIEEVREELKWRRSVQCFDEIYSAGKSSKGKPAGHGGREEEDPSVFETLYEEEEEGTPTKRTKNEGTDTEFEHSDTERSPGRKKVERKLWEVKRERRLAGGWKAKFGSTLEVPGQRERMGKHADTEAIDTGATREEDTAVAFDQAEDDKSQDCGKDVPQILVTPLEETSADEQLPRNDVRDNTNTVEWEQNVLQDCIKEETIEKDTIEQNLRDVNIEEENSEEVNIKDNMEDSNAKGTNVEDREIKGNNMEDSNLEEDKTAARFESECVGANDTIEPRSPVQEAPDSPMPGTFPDDSEPDLPPSDYVDNCSDHGNGDIRW